MPYKSFKDLTVWQQSRDLAVSIYRITSQGKLAKDFGLRDQMRRSAVSVASNIAEGHDRSSARDFSHFLDMARGSSAELRTQLDIARTIGSIDSETFETVDNQCAKIAAMLTKLKRTLNLDKR
jgi:four helix bundle protein